MSQYLGTALMLLVTIGSGVGCSAVNLQAATERAEVEKLQRQLAADAKDMRNLRLELINLSRTGYIQSWHGQLARRDGTAMAAPLAWQFLRSPVQLASFAAPSGTPALRYAVTPPQAPVAPAGVVQVAATTAPPGNDSVIIPVARRVPVGQPARLLRASYEAPARPALNSPVDDVAAAGAAAPRDLLPAAAH